ncbi:MAG: hypothetical protein ACLS9K_10070 [Lachnospira eligens]
MKGVSEIVLRHLHLQQVELQRRLICSYEACEEQSLLLLRVFDKAAEIASQTDDIEEAMCIIMSMQNMYFKTPDMLLS